MPLTAKQLEMRRTGISASEIAAVAGISPWDTPLGIWQKKIFPAEERAETNAMKFGNYVEDSIAAWYSDETGTRLLRSRTRRHPKIHWMLATPDRTAVVDGRQARLVECKSIGPKTSDDWGENPEDIPDYYRAQIEWQMEVTGMEECDVAALFLTSRDFKIYRVRRNEVLSRQLIKIGQAFWYNHVLSEVPPPLDATEATRRYLLGKYPANRRNELVAAPAEAEALAREYKSAMADSKAADERKELAKHRLCELIGDADGILGPWGRATWKLDRQGRVEWKGLAETLLTAYGDEKQRNLYVEDHRGKPDRRFLVNVKDD